MEAQSGTSCSHGNPEATESVGPCTLEYKFGWFDYNVVHITNPIDALLTNDIKRWFATSVSYNLKLVS